jgi:hypothetical protein
MFPSLKKKYFFSFIIQNEAQRLPMGFPRQPDNWVYQKLFCDDKVNSRIAMLRGTFFSETAGC